MICSGKRAGLLNETTNADEGKQLLQELRSQITNYNRFSHILGGYSIGYQRQTCFDASPVG